MSVVVYRLCDHFFHVIEKCKLTLAAKKPLRGEARRYPWERVFLPRRAEERLVVRTSRTLLRSWGLSMIVPGQFTII